MTTIVYPNIHQKRGGRPKSATGESKRHGSICMISAKNEITVKYSELLANKGTQKRLVKGILKRIITEVTEERDLPEGTVITPASIASRMKRGRLITNYTTGDLYSLLLDLEPAAVAVIIKMDRIRHSLQSSDGLRLINSMLQDTTTQEKLVNWKLKYSHYQDNIGDIGRGY